MNKNVFFEDLGLIDYKKCWDYQEFLLSNILSNKSGVKKNKTNNYLIFCQHNHVYTLGRNGNKENLLVNEGYLKS